MQAFTTGTLGQPESVIFVSAVLLKTASSNNIISLCNCLKLENKIALLISETAQTAADNKPQCCRADLLVGHPEKNKTKTFQ